MAKVSSDKRLNYYQLPAEAVVAELRSHAYGLTNPEAERRVSQNGFNRVSVTDDISAVAAIWQQCQSWLIALLVACLGLSWYASDGATAWTALGLILLIIISGLWREHRTESLGYNLDRLLPEQATVHRNSQDKVIDSLQLALGDMVNLQTGDRVPADLRLVEADGLTTDDSLLFGARGHSRKFTHALAAVMPISRRHNLAYLGTTVVAGSGRGVVIATGMQTELGRLVSLAQVTTPKHSLLQDYLRKLSDQMGWMTVVLAIGIVVTADLTGLARHASLTVLAALTAAMAPVGVALAAGLMFVAFGRRQRRAGLDITEVSSTDRLATVNILFLDESGLVVAAEPVAQEVLIGKDTYRCQGEGFQPTGKLLTENGKAVGKKALADLSLFFEAAALTSRAHLLPPDAEHNDWHVAGASAEGALLTLAHRAGIDPQSLRADSELIREYPYDHQRQLASSIRTHSHRQLVFVYGSAEAALARSKQLWDAGHTRKLTAADRTRLQTYINDQVALGNHCLALAYRPLAGSEKAVKLGMAKAEQDLILLGLVAIGQPLRHEAVLALQAARSSHIACALISERDPAVALAVARRAGLAADGDEPVLITADQLAKLDDSPLAELLQAGNVVFLHLSPEERLRLVDAAKQSGLTVAITGHTLGDIPAMRHATLGIALGDSTPIVRQESDMVLASSDPHVLTRGISRSRRLANNLQHAAWVTMTDQATQVLVVLIGLAMLIVWHVPLALTALQILLINALFQAFPLAALGQDKSTHRFSRGDTSNQLAYHSGWSALTYGGVAAILVCLNFLFFFARAGLSPSFIYAGSNLYYQAATLSLVSLSLCGWVNIVFVRAEYSAVFFSRQLLHNRALLRSFALSAVIIIALVYDPPLQSWAGTRGLTPADWLCALIVAFLYGALRWVGHAERLHSRHAVITLHHEVHGHHTGAQI